MPNHTYIDCSLFYLIHNHCVNVNVNNVIGASKRVSRKIVFTFFLVKILPKEKNSVQNCQIKNGVCCTFFFLSSQPYFWSWSWSLQEPRIAKDMQVLNPPPKKVQGSSCCKKKLGKMVENRNFYWRLVNRKLQQGKMLMFHGQLSD